MDLCAAPRVEGCSTRPIRPTKRPTVNRFLSLALVLTISTACSAASSLGRDDTTLAPAPSVAATPEATTAPLVASCTKTEYRNDEARICATLPSGVERTPKTATPTMLVFFPAQAGAGMTYRLR